MRKPAGHNLTSGVVETLGIAIVTGEYNDDNPLPIEAALCIKHGVSRSILREAVKMLTAKGLLSARPRQGTVVAPEYLWNLFDPDVLRWLLERKASLSLLAEFTEVRLAIEPMAAALAARRSTAATVAHIHRALARMKAAEQGADDSLASDIAFHVAVLQASGNRFYMQFEELIGTALRTSIRLTNQLKGVAVGNVADHRRVLNAIEAGDAERAHAAMDAIIREVVRLIENARKRLQATPRPQQRAARSKS